MTIVDPKTEAVSSSQESLTLKKLEKAILDVQDEFEKQRKKFGNVIGFTFTPSAWEIVKAKLKKAKKNESLVITIDQWSMDGLPCYICNKQRQPVIGWYDKEVMDAYIKVNGDMSELPEDIMKKLLGMEDNER